MSVQMTQPETPLETQAASPSMTPQAAAAALSPSFKLPLGIGAIALPLLLWHLWAGGAVLLLALFLAVQTTRIRLAFAPTELQVRLGDRLLRQFPYEAWRNWVIFWPPVPILFYFREVNSIHFLPVLFDPNGLQAQLSLHCDIQPSDTQPSDTQPSDTQPSDP
ncbi:MAG: DUF3119 family protein [Cyanobacteria bacterium P01_A01_bin.105]